MVGLNTRKHRRLEKVQRKGGSDHKSQKKLKLHPRMHDFLPDVAKGDSIRSFDADNRETASRNTEQGLKWCDDFLGHPNIHR